MEEETVTISKKEHDEMLDSLRMFRSLCAAGVDNWSGLGLAVAIYESGHDPDDYDPEAGTDADDEIDHWLTNQQSAD